MKHSMEDHLTDIKPGKGEPNDSHPVGHSKILKHGKLIEPEYSDDNDDVASPIQADLNFIVDGVAENTGIQRALAFQLARAQETHMTLS